MNDAYRRRLSIPGMTDAEDRLFGVALAMASEIAVLRERLDTIERLLDSKGMISPEEIEDFRADASVQDERDAVRKRFISKVLKPVRDGMARDAEALASEAGGTQFDTGEPR